MVSRFEKFLIDINEIDFCWHRIASAEMKAYGLKGNYVIYFLKLHEHPEGMTAARLGEACGRDKADVSRDMAALEKAGFVERSGTTAYRVPIVLTEKGRMLTDEIARKAELAVGLVGGVLTEEERTCFYRVLDTITENLHALCRTGLPDEN